MKKINRLFRKLFTSKKIEVDDKGYNSFEEYLYSMSVDHFNFLNKNTIRVNVLFGVKIEDLKYLSYEMIKIKIPAHLENNRINLVFVDILKEMEKEITIEDINNYNYKLLLYFLFWVLDSIKEINELEKEYLEYFPDADLINAGINEFNQFGIVNTIDALADGNILNWDAVVKLAYLDVFTKLKKDKIEAEFNKRYNKIITSKK